VKLNKPACVGVLARNWKKIRGFCFHTWGVASRGSAGVGGGGVLFIFVIHHPVRWQVFCQAQSFPPHFRFAMVTWCPHTLLVRRTVGGYYWRMKTITEVLFGVDNFQEFQEKCLSISDAKVRILFEVPGERQRTLTNTHSGRTIVEGGFSDFTTMFACQLF